MMVMRTTRQLSSKPSEVSTTVHLADSSDIAGLFGAVPEVVKDYEGKKTPVPGVNGVQVALFNEQSQVFAKEKWQVSTSSQAP